MEIFIDSQPLANVGLQMDNLEQVLEAVVNRHLPSDRTVTEILINGQTYSESRPRDAANIGYGDIDRLDILTIETADLAKLMLNTGPGNLESLRLAATKVSEMFRVDDPEEANSQFFIFLEALQDFFLFLSQVLEAMAMPLSELEAEGLSATAKLNELSELLSDIRDRQDEQDWVLLADLLEYELAPLLDDWATILVETRKVIH